MSYLQRPTTVQEVPTVQFLKYILQRLERLHLLVYEFHGTLYLKKNPTVP